MAGRLISTLDEPSGDLQLPGLEPDCGMRDKIYHCFPHSANMTLEACVFALLGRVG